ncbi:MAG: hypothetical protein HUU56_17315 [Bdellovibrionaceae bacterium]|nr:hypothetical protein [Pseudobdellovibrionaceae bacterium]
MKEKLNLLTNLANESLNGMATISKSDVVNMILELHSNELTKLEVDLLRKTHLDIFKHLSWLQAQAKLAKERGDDLSLSELMKKSNEFMAEESSSQSVKTRKPRKKKLLGNSEPVETSERKSNSSE